MNDEFLHRLRKEPRPQFAARLQARLRRQALSPLPPIAASRARTLLTLLLLCGTAFAVTTVAMRGLPPSLLVIYRHAAAWMGGERGASPARRVTQDGVGEGLRWGASGYNPAHGAALRGGGTTHSAARITSAQPAERSSAGSPAGTAPVGGAPAGPGVAQTRVAASWSAYPYVAALAESVNNGPNPPVGQHVEVSLRDSDSWPRPLCSDSAQAPDLAYAFGFGSSVISIPCPGSASDNATPVRAVPVGYEGVVLARSPLYGELDLTRRQIFLALAKWVPDPARAGTVHENANTTWRQIDASRGTEPIEFMGPPLSSAAGHSMIELLMEGGCDTYPWIAALESTHPDRYARICRTVRTDGVYAEVAGLSPETLLEEPNAVGIFGFGPLSSSPPLGALLTSKLDGVAPGTQALVSSAYPGVRTLYLYTRRRVPPVILEKLLLDEFAVHLDWVLVPPQDFRLTLRAVQGF